MHPTWLARPATVWTGFALVHAWLTWVGVVVAPARSFHDVDLYRWWMYQGLTDGVWPVLDGPWVYPAGAVLPMLPPALAGTVSTAAYALAWCVLVAALDAVAATALLRVDRRRGAVAVWWWLAFLVALGPVAIGRLDAIVAPLMVLALLLGLRRPRLAAALLTVGAWIKVAPGALLLPLATAARHPMRDVVVPALAVCTVIVAGVAVGGGLANITSFLGTQTGRGLQVESVTATPWVLASLTRDDVAIRLNDALITWEVTGPGTTAAAGVLDVLLVLAVAVVGGLLWRARTEGRSEAAFLPGALLLLAVLVVVNKVGSPQLLAWLAAPVAVLLARPDGVGRRWLRSVAGGVLAAAALTQVVFPWAYLDLLDGSGGVAAVLTARNLLLVTVLVLAVVGLVRAAGPAGVRPEVVGPAGVRTEGVGPAGVRPEGAGPAAASRTP